MPLLFSQQSPLRVCIVFFLIPSLASAMTLHRSSKHPCRGCHSSQSQTPPVSPSSPSQAGSVPTQCSTQLGDRFSTTSLSVIGKPPASNEDYPVVIVPQNDGNFLLSWSDPNAGMIRFSHLDAHLQQSSQGSFPGSQVHAGLADQRGTVLAVVSNDPEIYSPKYCKSEKNAEKPVCAKMELVKLDSSDNIQFRTQLTQSVAVDREGANFIWWYGHSARIASNGERYGVYYRTAGSYARPNAPGEIDIHAGDALRFVTSSGQRIDGAGWDWGCSHSWSVRFAYSQGTWAAACHGDAYPNAMQLALLSESSAEPVKHTWLAETNPTQRALGGLVASSNPNGFWLNYLSTENGQPRLHLALFSSASGQIVQEKTIASGGQLDASASRYPYRAYLAPYQHGQLLVGWKSPTGLQLAVASATTGEILQGPVQTAMNIDDFDDFISTPNGDVVWATSVGDGSIAVNRVAACPPSSSP